MVTIRFSYSDHRISKQYVYILHKHKNCVKSTSNRVVSWTYTLHDVTNTVKLSCTHHKWIKMFHTLWPLMLFHIYSTTFYTIHRRRKDQLARSSNSTRNWQRLHSHKVRYSKTLSPTDHNYSNITKNSTHCHLYPPVPINNKAFRLETTLSSYQV